MCRSVVQATCGIAVGETCVLDSVDYNQAYVIWYSMLFFSNVGDLRLVTRSRYQVN